MYTTVIIIAETVNTNVIHVHYACSVHCGEDSWQLMYVFNNKTFFFRIEGQCTITLYLP